MNRLKLSELWRIIRLLPILLLVLSPAVFKTPVHAAIVDVSGIEVPPVNGPVCANCDGAGCDQCQPSDPDPDPEPDPDPTPPTNTNTNTNTNANTNTNTVTPPPVDQEALRREQFAREKQALLDDFAMPSDLSSFTSYDVPADADPIEVEEDTVMGVGLLPTGLSQPGGLSAEEWKKAGDCQRQLDALYAKWPLSNEEITLMERLESQRNALWKKAVSIPGLTGEERERIRLKFHIAGNRPTDPPVPEVSKDTIEKWQKPTPNSSTPVTVNPVTAMVLKEFLVNRPTAGIEYYGQEVADTIMDDSPFGDMLGIAKIAYAYKKEGQASARAAAADFLVGLLRYPQASFAVDGGRVYAKVTFQAMNKFMSDAMKATGGEFDKEKFWSELKDESSNGTKGFMEWIGDGKD